MNFIKNMWNNKSLIIQLGKNEFKNKFASTSLGAIWGFVQPFIFMITYVIVFQFILKTNSSGDAPYIIWFLPGMTVWLFINDAIVSSSMSIRNYSYLVKKVVFPVDIIPVITLVSTSIVGFFLVLVSIVVCSSMGFLPNILLLIYVLFAIYIFIVSITRITSTICTILPDFCQLLTVLMQLFFWFTPVVWNLSMLESHKSIYNIMNCMPITYLVNGMRSVFVEPGLFFKENLVATIIFWLVTFICFIWGNRMFDKNKKDFADVL